MKSISSVQGCQEQTLFKIKASGNQSLEFFVNTAWGVRRKWSYIPVLVQNVAS